jgi:hypothetical protein
MPWMIPYRVNLVCSLSIGPANNVTHAEGASVMHTWGGVGDGSERLYTTAHYPLVCLISP